MTWVILFVAGFLEIGFAIGLKYSEAFSRLWPSPLSACSSPAA
jgi:quaternary ammonium compound-resistance protein SugE